MQVLQVIYGSQRRTLPPAFATSSPWTATHTPPYSSGYTGSPPQSPSPSPFSPPGHGYYTMFSTGDEAMGQQYKDTPNNNS